MVRARIRADQIRDPDLLTEAEHAVLVHKNLTTSGTLNFQDGTISGTGDVYATTYYGDGSKLTGVAAGNPESLYYNGSDIRATATSDGIDITNGTDTATIDITAAPTLNITSPGESITLIGNDSGLKNIIVGTAHGAADLYYAGSKRLSTYSQGVLVYRDTNYCKLVLDVGGGTILSDDTLNKWLLLRATDSSGSSKNLLWGYPEGAVKLYYAGTKVFNTESGGFTVGDGTDIADLQFFNGILRLKNYNHGGAINIVGEDNSGSQKNIFNADPDSAVTLYYNGSERLLTHNSGVEIRDGSNVSRLTGYSFRCHTNSTTIYLYGTNSSSSQTTILSGDPDGITTLYYAGNERFKTSSTGLKLFGNISSKELWIDAATSVSTITSVYNNSALQLQAYSGGSAKAIIKGIGNGATELYYSGTKVFETTDLGINLYGSTASSELDIFEGSGGYYTIRNNLSGKGIYLTTDGGLHTNAAFEGSGRTTLYYNNVGVFRTNSEGINVRDTGFLYGTTDFYIENQRHGYKVYIRADDSSGSPKNLLVGSGEGAVELYYAGNKKFETTASGINVIDTITQDGERIYTQSEVDDLITTVSGNLQSQIDDLQSQIDAMLAL